MITTFGHLLIFTVTSHASHVIFNRRSRTVVMVIFDIGRVGVADLLVCADFVVSRPKAALKVALV